MFCAIIKMGDEDEHRSKNFKTAKSEKSIAAGVS